MSATSSKPRSLKRLSLLQSPTSLSSPSSSNFASPVVPSKYVDLTLTLAEPNELNSPDIQPSPVSSVSSSTSARPGNVFSKKNARRQSSIYYVSQDREHDRVARDVCALAKERKVSTLQDRSSTGIVDSETKPEGRSLVGIDEQSAPVTLAEKHADLLRFIAQKESRCLELRSQLATEEAELLALKRKWERIVSRQIKRESSAPTSSLDAELSAQNNVLSGLKEGVQGVGRLLAHLGELGAHGSESDAGHASNSSISTMMSSSSSPRLSQSSISSLGMIEDEASPDGTNADSDTTSLPSKRLSLSTPVRRKPYEPSSPSTPSSSIVMPRTPLFASSANNSSSVPAPSRSQSTDTVTTHPCAKHMKRLSAVSGSLPPASSIPGISVAPLASWVEGVGKRLVSQVTSSSNSTSYSTSGSTKRTSLFSDGASSLFSSLTSPTRTTQPTPHVIDLPRLDSPSFLDDDDTLGEGTGVQWASMATLSPDRPKLMPAPASTAPKSLKGPIETEPRTGGQDTRDSDDDSEEWNW